MHDIIPSPVYESRHLQVKEPLTFAAQTALILQGNGFWRHLFSAKYSIIVLKAFLSIWTNMYFVANLKSSFKVGGKILLNTT